MSTSKVFSICWWSSSKIDYQHNENSQWYCSHCHCQNNIYYMCLYFWFWFRQGWGEGEGVSGTLAYTLHCWAIILLILPNTAHGIKIWRRRTAKRVSKYRNILRGVSLYFLHGTLHRAFLSVIVCMKRISQSEFSESMRNALFLENVSLRFKAFFCEQNSFPDLHIFLNHILNIFL